MTLRQQKAFSNIILHCSLTLSITKMQKRVAYWRLIDLASLSMSISECVSTIQVLLNSHIARISNNVMLHS